MKKYGSDTKQQRGEPEVDEQGQGVHNGGDEGRGHHRGVKPYLFRQNGQGAAHQLGTDHRAHQRGADHQRHHGRYGGVMHQPAVNQHHFAEVGGGQAETAANGYPEFLPQHLEGIGEPHLSQGQGADDGGGGLGAAVAAGTGQHGHEGGQDGAGHEGVLKMGEDDAGEGGGEH